MTATGEDQTDRSADVPAEIAETADFVVVANRLPVDKETLPDGTIRWKRSPGGLVTALEPILRSRTGLVEASPGLHCTGGGDPVRPCVHFDTSTVAAKPDRTLSRRC